MGELHQSPTGKFDRSLALLRIPPEQTGQVVQSDGRVWREVDRARVLATRLFLTSIAYLPLLFSLMLLDPTRLPF